MALPMILLLNWLYSCLLMFFIENSKYFQYSFNTGSTKGSTQGPRRIQHRVRGDSQHRDHGVFFSVPLRSEEHTSELQSRGHLVCRLLLEKKNVSHNIHSS